MNRKKGGFFLVEIVISVTILVAVSFGFFNLYLILKNSADRNYNMTKLLFFSDYFYHLLQKSDIPEFTIDKKFYTYIENNVVKFTDNPGYNNCNVDFFMNPSVACSHEISYFYSGSLSGVPYKIYKANIDYNHETIDFYVIK